MDGCCTYKLGAEKNLTIVVLTEEIPPLWTYSLVPYLVLTLKKNRTKSVADY